MNQTTSSRFLRLPAVVATAIFLSISGCDGGATISPSFSVQQPAAQTTQQANTQQPGAEQINTQASTAQDNAGQQSTEQDNTEQANASPPTIRPAEQQTPSQNDASVEQATVTVSNEVPQPTTFPNPNPAPADITDLILITGQSNALGADTAFDRALDGSDNRTFAYTESGWQVADLHQIWDLGWFPRGDAATGPSNNLSLHFGKRITSQDSSRVVGFILATAPGQPISTWHPTGEFFNSIRNKVSRAINELPSKSRLDGILWHQGESDGEDDPAYGTALYQLIEAFRSEGWYGTGLPFICGETAALPVNRQLNRLNSDGNPDTACIAAAGLETRGDDAHFSAGALRIIGRRYADQYLQMTR